MKHGGGGGLDGGLLAGLSENGPVRASVGSGGAHAKAQDGGKYESF